MAQAQPQTYANHARLVPAFHFVAFPILAVNFLWSAYRVATGFSWETALAALVALALIIVALCARLFALWAQDRVIRLEMRLKMAELLPDDLKARIPDLTTSQLVALRFRERCGAAGVGAPDAGRQPGRPESDQAGREGLAG